MRMKSEETEIAGRGSIWSQKSRLWASVWSLRILMLNASGAGARCGERKKNPLKGQFFFWEQVPSPWIEPLSSESLSCISSLWPLTWDSKMQTPQWAHTTQGRYITRTLSQSRVTSLYNLFAKTTSGNFFALNLSQKVKESQKICMDHTLDFNWISLKSLACRVLSFFLHPVTSRHRAPLGPMQNSVITLCPNYLAKQSPT